MRVVLFLITCLVLLGCKKSESPTENNSNNTINSQDTTLIYFAQDTISSKGTGCWGEVNYDDTKVSLLTNPMNDNIDTFQQKSTGLLSKYELSMPPVIHQYNLPICQSVSIGYYVKSYNNRVVKGQSTYSEIFSPLYLFNQGVANKVHSLITAADYLVNSGTCRWSSFPLPIPADPNAKEAIPFSDTSKTPSVNAIIEAESNRSLSYGLFQSYDVQNFKYYLSYNYPITVAVDVDKSFKKNGKNVTKKLDDGRYVWIAFGKGEAKEGHTLVLCGYDDDIHAFKAVNSWGNKWGNEGYIWIDYDFLPAALTYKVGYSRPNRPAALVVLDKFKVSNGLVGYYRCNSNALDASNNGNNGAAVGGVTPVIDRHGKPDNAYKFDGTTGYIDIQNSFSLSDISNGITISAWVYSNDGNCYIVCKSEHGYPIQFRLSGASNGTWSMVSYNKLQGTNVESLFQYNTPHNQWFHVAVTTDGSLASFYINGQQIGTPVIPISTPASWQRNTTTSMNIGADPHGSSGFPIDFFKGNLDDIRIYNRPLSTQEVQSIYLYEK